MTPRSADRRTADALAHLEAPKADAWVATASADGEAHLVPLSIGWDGERVVVATEPASLTARNLVRAGRARLALGGTRDVVMIDAALEAQHPVRDAPAGVAEPFAAQSDWDPRTSEKEFVFLVLRPDRVQVWREADEIAGRTVMRDGRWLSAPNR